MAIQLCARCGADLPVTAPGTTVKCAYCGATQLVGTADAAGAVLVPVVADAARVERLYGLLLDAVLREHGVDLSHDATATERLRRAATLAVSELETSDRASVNVPFLGATVRGPFHLARTVTHATLAHGFEPVVAGVEEQRALAHGEELGTQEARLEALRLRLGVPEEVRPASRSSLFGCAVLLGLLAVAGGLAFYFVGRDSPPSVVVTDVDKGDGWVELRPDGMPGSLERFDPVAGAPWALGIARQWAPDARFESIYLTGVRADGLLAVNAHGDETDVVGQPEADYRFVSPARRVRAAQRLEVARNDVRSSFRVDVENGHVIVLSSTEGAEDLHDDSADAPTALDVSRCPLARVVGRMRAGGLPRRPGWDLATTWGSGRWAWWVNMTQVPSLPRVDAVTCDVVN